MKLDYNPANRMYVLTVKRGEEPNPEILMSEYGLSHSQSGSTPREAMLFTPCPYAAASFAHVATPGAREKLGWIVAEVEASRAPRGTGHYDVPRALLEQGTDLWDYQKADLDYMLKRDRVLDGDEPGLGKTPTAIVYANMIEAQRVLVVCPASIRFQWLRKIVGSKEDGPGWSTMGQSYRVNSTRAYPVITAKGGVDPTAAWTVVSYELARDPGILAALRQTKYDLLVLDEAHYLKSVGSRRTRAIFGGGHDPLYHEALADRAKRVVALSGTPLPNRPREAYVLARNFDHAAIDYLSEDRFGAMFNPIEMREVYRKDGSMAVISDESSGRHAELQNRLRAHFMCRHLKREVMTQLKYPIYDLVRMDEMTPPVRAALKAESLLGIDPEHLEGATAEILGHIAEARRMMGEAMAPQVAKYVEMCLDGGEPKITLFYWHINVGNILQQHLGKFGVCRVDGGTSPVQKDALVQRFQQDPRYRIMMGNVMSLGTGTDGLQHVCSHAVIGEPDWVPGNNVQCFDRLDRGGQKVQVQGDICVVPGSLAERVLSSALRKLKTTHAALDRRVA